MKKYIIILVCGLLFAFTSCGDFLDVDSPSAFPPHYVFSNSEETKKELMGVYAMFAQDSYTSRMSAVWMQNTDVEVSLPGANPEGNRRDIWSLEGGRLEGFKDIFNAWQDNYLAIDRANQCIEGISHSPIANEPAMKMMLGEAYCLRAYRYFLLCNFWGDVPYFREAAKYGSELDKPKTDKNYIYTGILQDMINVESNMYFADQFGDGIERMNREFALGLIARIALFRAGYGTTKDGSMKRADDYMDVAGDAGLAVKYTYNGVEKTARTSGEYYQLAKDYCEKLIAQKDRALNPDFMSIFKNECEWVKKVNDDVLYEVAYGDVNGGGDVGWCIGVAVTGGSKGKTTIQVGLSPAYYYSFDRSDLRRDATVSKISYTDDKNQAVVSPTSLGVAKWNRLWLKSNPGAESSKGTGINWPLMRYSDILLMLAEAENELNGPTQLAKNALSRVRERAFSATDRNKKVTEYVNNLTSKEQFFNAVVDERAWEFGGECLRKFDLGRWNIYGKKIIETKTILDNIGKAAYELNLNDPNVAKYTDYADVIYYQKKNGTIVFLNDYYKATEIPQKVVDAKELDKPGNADAYAKIDWGRALYKRVGKAEPYTYESADLTQRSWRGYTDPTGIAPVPFLLPISSSTVGDSKFLNNDGYGLVTK